MTRVPPAAGRHRHRSRPQAPLRRCEACGRRFRSWHEDRYCGRDDCRELRLFGPAGDPSPEPPAPRGPGELPEGF